MRIMSRVSCASVATSSCSSSRRSRCGGEGQDSVNSRRLRSCSDGGTSSRRKLSATCPATSDSMLAAAICRRLSNRRCSSIRRRSCWMRSASPPAWKSMTTGLTRCTCWEASPPPLRTEITSTRRSGCSLAISERIWMKVKAQFFQGCCLLLVKPSYHVWNSSSSSIVGLCCNSSRISWSVGMSLEQQIPQELAALTVQAFTNHLHSVAQRDLGDLRVAKGGGPVVQPRTGRCSIVDRVVQHGHQVRLAQAALANRHHRTALVRADRLDPFEQIAGRIRDLQKRLGSHLRRAGIFVVGKLDGRPFEAIASKFFSQGQVQHCFRSSWSPLSDGRLPVPFPACPGTGLDCCSIQPSISTRENRHPPPTPKAGISLAAAGR